MNLIATLPVHNEAWVIRASLRAVLDWCDAAVVLLHACTDWTAEIVQNIAAWNPGRVHILTDDDPVWREMQHRQSMLEAAREMGATHIAVVDSDEILSANLVPQIREQVERLRPGQLMMIPGYNLRGGLTHYHVNGLWGNRQFPVVFPDEPGMHWSGDLFHHREPMGALLQRVRLIDYGRGGILHLWGASERRLIAKHRMYKLTERLRWPEKSITEINRMYNLAIYGFVDDAPSTWKYAPVPADWWGPYRAGIDVDAVPSQEAECERLIAQHGREKFAGLDLFEEVRQEVVA